MRRLTALALFASACIRLPGSTGDTFVDPCPGNLVTANSALINVGDFRVGGVLAAIDYDPLQFWNDQPAACVSRTGKAAEVVLTYDGQAVGTLHAEVPSQGAFELSAGAPASLSLSLDGAALPVPIVLSTRQWLSGNLIGELVGETLLFYVENGEGISAAGEEIYLNLEVEMTVPVGGLDTGGGGSDDDTGN